MSDQYVVAILMDCTLNVTVLGPYRSRAKAESVAAKIEKADGDSGMERLSAVIPQIVKLSSLEDVFKELRGTDDE